MAGSETWDPDPPHDGSPEDWLRWANALPMSKALNLVCSELFEGRLVGEVATPPLTPNPNGSVNGGLQLAIADQAMGLIANSTQPPGFLAVTSTLSSSFHRPAIAPLTVRAELRSGGRTLSHVDVEMFDREGRLCTTASGSMAILSAESVTSPKTSPGV